MAFRVAHAQAPMHLTSMHMPTGNSLESKQLSKRCRTAGYMHSRDYMLVRLQLHMSLSMRNETNLSLFLTNKSPSAYMSIPPRPPHNELRRISTHQEKTLPKDPGGVETRDAVVDIWGHRTGYNGNDEIPWPARIDQYTSEAPDKWVQSACVLCSNGCGMDIGVKNGKIVGVRGRECDQVNKVRLYAHI